MDLTELVILSLVSVISMALALRRKDQKSISLTGGLALSFLVLWIKDPNVYLGSSVLYILMAVLIAFSVLKEKEATTWNRTVVIILCSWAALSKLFQLNDWPYANEVTVSMAIPIILYQFAFNPQYQSKIKLEYLYLLSLDMLLRVIL